MGGGYWGSALFWKECKRPTGGAGRSFMVVFDLCGRDVLGEDIRIFEI